MFDTIQELEQYVDIAFPDNDDELIKPEHVRGFAHGVIEFLKKVFDAKVFLNDDDAKAPITTPQGTRPGLKIGDIYLLAPGNDYGYPPYSFRTIKS